jgi:hypothetical protein
MPGIQPLQTRPFAARGHGGGAERGFTLRRQQLQPLADGVLGLGEAVEEGRGNAN